MESMALWALASSSRPKSGWQAERSWTSWLVRAPFYHREIYSLYSIEDMMERYATAIAAPFDSLKCEKIAKSYFMCTQLFTSDHDKLSNAPR